MEQGVKILFVDDEENILRALNRLFIDEDDYTILTASSGAEGLEILERETGIMLVVSDYRMPGMNGVEFLREVHNRWPECVRIVLSGYADTAAVVEAINEGQIYKFIAKPWNDEEIKGSIFGAIDNYRLNQKNRSLTLALQESNFELETINNNLEKLVAERTAALELRNEVLTRAQNFLHNLPLGVIGIDSDGLVAQCNQVACDILGNCFGFERKKALPLELNELIDKALTSGPISEALQCGEKCFCLHALNLPDNGASGVVVLFIPKGLCF